MIAWGEGEEPPCVAKALKLAQDEPYFEDEIDEAAAEDLEKNRTRTDLWKGADTGKMSGLRWQTERAANNHRNKGNLAVANWLDEWAEKCRRAEFLHEKQIYLHNV